LILHIVPSLQSLTRPDFLYLPLDTQHSHYSSSPATIRDARTLLIRPFPVFTTNISFVERHESIVYTITALATCSHIRKEMSCSAFVVL
jgi:hypothetical protein